MAAEHIRANPGTFEQELERAAATGSGIVLTRREYMGVYATEFNRQAQGRYWYDARACLLILRRLKGVRR